MSASHHLSWGKWKLYAKISLLPVSKREPVCSVPVVDLELKVRLLPFLCGNRIPDFSFTQVDGLTLSALDFSSHVSIDGDVRLCTRKEFRGFVQISRLI